MKATTASPESFNGSPVRLDSVDSYIFGGLQERFLSVFNTKAIWTTSSDKVKALEKLFPDRNAPGGKITYPYAFLIINSWQKMGERGNLRAASLRGTQVMVSNDELTTLKTRFMPVDFAVSVEWYSNSFKDLQDIGRRWMFAPQRGHLNFNIDYGQTVFGIKVVPEDSVNFPQREADPDNVQEYMMTTTLLLHGFISEPEMIQQQVVETVEGTVSTDLPATEANTLWVFKTPPIRK